MDELFAFNDKVVLVTGSGRGVGEATAVLFASKGANVVVTDLNEANINEVAEKCRAASPHKNKALAVVCDLNDEKQIKILFDKTIATFGGLNVLVNNAGWYTEVNVLDENVLQLANKHYAVNIRAIIQLCHHFMPFLIKSKGAVVNVSSIPIPFYPHYYFNVTTSRAAADMLAKNMAAQFAANGVRVNTVNVGGVDTPSFNEMKSAEEKRKVLCEFTPLRRLGKSEEIAKAILFLASDMAEYITGVNLPVDGGALLL